MIQIEKGIPFPTKPKGIPRIVFEKMEVGDSFLVPADVPLPSARARAHEVGERIGRKFSCSKIGCRLRCWRIA